jgi:hypothetical protein
VTPSQTVPSLLHLVTQWMSTVTSVRGSAWNSSQVHLAESDPLSRRLSVHLSSSVSGVGPALRTGKSSVRYWPGGIRFRSSLARGRCEASARGHGWLMVSWAPSSATKTARRLAGSVALAFSLTRCSLPGGSKKVSPAL